MKIKHSIKVWNLYIAASELSSPLNSLYYIITVIVVSIQLIKWLH